MDNLEILEITDKKTWEDFISSQDKTPFLQAWNTGTHFSALGEKIFRYGLYKENSLDGVFFLSKVDARRGTYLYCPYGPIFKEWNRENFKTFTEFIKKLAKEEGASFLKLSPYIKNSTDILDLFKEFGYLKSQIHVLSETSWCLDLSLSEEDLMKNMKKNTRNLIRRASKEEVTTEKSKNPKDVDVFFDLYKETGERHKFVLYPYDFVKEQVKAFLEDDQVLILKAWYKEEVISCAVIMYYGSEGAYHHGASTHKYSKIPASYLLQWEAIKEAKSRGMKTYNFWGIYDGENPNHPFKGITHFKRSFGGFKNKFLPAHDLPISWKYWINYSVEKWRKIKRGF